MCDFTEETLNTKIVALQCRQGILGLKLSKALAFGQDKQRCLNLDNIAVTYLLNVLECYRPFTSAVTFASKYEFVKTSSEFVVVGLSISTASYSSYAGTGTSTEIVDFFVNEINDSETSPQYKAERVGDTLYIYSYDEDTNFSDTASITIIGSPISIDVTNIQNDLDEILNIWNCFTEDDLCELIQFTTDLSGEDCGCGCS